LALMLNWEESGGLEGGKLLQGRGGGKEPTWGAKGCIRETEV